MNSKNNRVNHDFQIKHFLAGSCHTPDGAYSLLCDLREDRELALNTVKATQLRSQAKWTKAKTILATSMFDFERLEAEADIAEIEAYLEIEAKNIAAAEAELTYINECIEKLQPLRKYAHLPDPEAHEAAQEEEWKLELIHRGENYLLTMGTIPADHFSTMRMHPAFKTEILPALGNIRMLMNTEPDHVKLINKLDEDRFNLPKLLEKKE